MTERINSLVQGSMTGKYNQYRETRDLWKHRSALVGLYTLQNFAGRIDKEIEQQYQTHSKCWVDVIKRIVVAISFLAERGFGFRGSDARFNSVHNGNYLGLLEVIENLIHSFLITSRRREIREWKHFVSV